MLYFVVILMNLETTYILHTQTLFSKLSFLLFKLSSFTFLLQHKIDRIIELPRYLSLFAQNICFNQ